MKKTFFQLLVFSVLLTVTQPVIVSAQTTPTKEVTPTQTPTPASQNLDKIKILKEKVATKVAEIRNTEKKGRLGTIDSLTKETLSLNTFAGSSSISLSEDTTVYEIHANGDRVDSTASNLEKGDTVAVLGYEDPASSTIDAKYIYILTTPVQFYTGTITEIDRKNFTTSIKTDKNTSVLIDIEPYTKTAAYNKAEGETKSGFSKLEVGFTIQVIGTSPKKEENHISAQRILVLLDITQKNTTSENTSSSENKTVTPTKP